MSDSDVSHTSGKHTFRKSKVFYFAIVLPAVMFCLTFAAYPLYSVFCRVTGYGGTPNIVTDKEESASLQQKAVDPEEAAVLGTKPLTVRFNADVDENLPWKFYPEKLSVDVIPGKTATIYYVSENLTDEPIYGRATYNVTPHRVGGFITKVECFCFTEQVLQPREKKRMAMTFSIDPKIEQDRFLKDMNALTFSYTFFREDRDEE